MSGPGTVAVAVVFVWLGMVLAISFIEAPLKFRAPGVTVQIGLGIGRLVFRALNAAELLLGVVLLFVLAMQPPPLGVLVAVVSVVACLGVQLLAVRPFLTRRSDAVLAGEDRGRSRAHYVYIALEVIKCLALLLSGILLLAA